MGPAVLGVLAFTTAAFATAESPSRFCRRLAKAYPSWAPALCHPGDGAALVADASRGLEVGDPLVLTVGGFLPAISWHRWAKRDWAFLAAQPDSPQLRLDQSLRSAFRSQMHPVVDARGGREGGCDSRPAMEMALGDLEKHPCLLQGYHLQVDFKDTEVTAIPLSTSFPM